MRSFQIVENKVSESEFFLEKMEECTFEWSFFEIKYFISAFLSSTRSITFTMKASLHDLPGFDDWYKEQELKLRSSPLARFFLESRNLNQKVGYYPIDGCGSYVDKEGNNRIRYRFARSFEKEGIIVPELDAVEACTNYFNLLLEIVYDCYQKFGFDIDPDQYYTIENLNRLGLTVEDIEEKLGFPRGWTAYGGGSTAERVEAIRRSNSTLAVDPILIKRLGKNRFGEIWRAEP
jgi:hypothetical protein